MSLVNWPSRRNLPRRDLLKLSAAGVMSTSSTGWLLPRLAYANEKKAVRPRACIMLHMQGGMSQHHTFTVPEYKAQNQQIQTAVAGVLFCEHFPRLAARMGDICLIRGMSTGNTVHERARSPTLSPFTVVRTETARVPLIVPCPATWDRNMLRSR
ncbi:MAG: DUF1501 domain-containing protein [Planctomycetes bacterium]|nr:DUF1501 domain-containing protein [Planctomycetota bacterium]